MGIAVITFWTRILRRTGTKKHGFLKAFSVQIRVIVYRIMATPKELA